VKAAISAGHLGSVGAIERAVTIVHEELDWPGTDAIQGSHLAAAIDRYAPTAGADPSSPTALERRLFGPLVALSGSFGLDGTVDLTGVTRVADRAHPGSPANLALRAALAPVDGADGLGVPGRCPRDDTDGQNTNPEPDSEGDGRATDRDGPGEDRSEAAGSDESP